LSAGVKPLKSDRAMPGCNLSLRYHLSKSIITYVPTTNMMISLAEGSGCSLKDDISKEIPPKPGSGLIFKGLLPRIYGRISGYYKERAYQILENKTICNKANRYRLEKNRQGRRPGFMSSGHDTFLKVISISSSASGQISGV
jgi:hypothetical protein